jgi:CheY-like chemotaxis protein
MDDSSARAAPTLLLAEDDEDMRLLLAERLRRDGYEIVAVEDGFELLDYLEACGKGGRLAEPAVVVSDVRMPGRTGMEVLRTLSKRGLRFPIVLITAFCDPETREEALALGAYSVLDKPVDLDVLSDEVRRAARPSLPHAPAS